MALGSPVPTSFKISADSLQFSGSLFTSIMECNQGDGNHESENKNHYILEIEVPQVASFEIHFLPGVGSCFRSNHMFPQHTFEHHTILRFLGPNLSWNSAWVHWLNQRIPTYSKLFFVTKTGEQFIYILLMEEILHHLGCAKPCK